jgi:hypothetical protein
LAFVFGIAASLTAACGDSAVVDPPFADAGAEGASDAQVQCTVTQLRCGDACVDTASDPKNCGSCGAACLSGDLCCGSKCVQSASCGFAVTKIEPSHGNQNGGDWLRITGAGFTADMTLMIGDGRAPLLVLGPTTAVAQTPPGTVGSYDITIASASGVATTRQGFSYQSAPLAPPWKDVAMSTVRGEHPAVTPLQDGRVLIAGGTTVPDQPGKALNTGVLFSREGASGKVDAPANAMSTPRWRCSATTLLDGRAIVVGGPADAPAACVNNTCKSADLFDPVTNVFAAAKGLMSESRTFAWSVLMVDGRVMVTSDGSPTVDVYDPASDAFTQVALIKPHYLGQRIVRLRDGRVMVLGGDGCDGVHPCGPAQADAELFDPKTGKFTLAAPMKQGRSQFTAHVLPDGRVLVLGGASISAGGVHVPLDQIEAYDPKADTWTVMPYKLSTGRTWHASALVRDGTVLVMGGYNHDGKCDVTNTVDVVDPVKAAVSPFDTLTNGNTEWNAVTMLDGSVVAVGGGACGATQAFPDVYFLPGGPTPN